jgi:hypothetical protein
MVIRGGDDLTTGVTGLAGLTVPVVMNVGLFAFDRWVTDEPIPEQIRAGSCSGVLWSEPFLYEYERAGTPSIFVFVEPLAGWREVAVRETKIKVDWAIEMARLIEGRYAKVERVVVVCDTLNTHQGSLLRSLPTRPGRVS